MPDSMKTATDPLGLIQHVPTEVLEEKLHEYLLSDTALESAEVETIVAELQRREEPEAAVVDTAWERFQAERLGQKSEFLDCAAADNSPAPVPIGAKKPRKLRRLLRTAVAAILAATVLIASAYAAGFDLFALLARWNGDFFGRARAEKTETVEGLDYNAYQDLCSVLDKYTMASKLVPTYLPSGYWQKELSAYEIGTLGVVITANYTNGTDVAVFQYVRDEDDSLPEYAKDMDSPETVQHDGVEYYIFPNKDTYRAVWEYDGFECYISGFSDKQELKKIILSINEKE